MAALMKWDEIVKSTAISYVNHALTLGFAYLGQKLAFSPDILSADNIAVLAGAVVAGALSLTMLLYRKKKVHNLVEAAREAEPGTKFSVIKADAESKPIVGK